MKTLHGDWPENYSINLNNDIQVNIKAKAKKQDGGYLCKCYQRDFKSGSSLLSFK